LLGAWLGAALLFAVAVAPASFQVLPTRALAGALVGRVLPPLQVAGMVVAVISLLLTWSIGGNVLQRASLIAVAVLSAVAQFLIDPRIERIRERAADRFDALAPTDPIRATFGRLHAASVACLGAAMLASVVAIAIAARSVSRGDKSP
jgi:hypothetical protein